MSAIPSPGDVPGPPGVSDRVQHISDVVYSPRSFFFYLAHEHSSVMAFHMVRRFNDTFRTGLFTFFSLILCPL